MTDATIDRLQWLGQTRAMAYWTAAATGLRWNELRSITLGAVRLDADTPHIILQARDEKARRGAQIPVQADLAAALRLYLTERRSRLVGHSGTSVVAFPGSLDDAPVFDVPKKICTVFDADCEAAKIPKRDGAGRVVDVHALRHTFGTMLAKAGVSLQVAQKAMRHSTPTLTANVYTHLGLLDIAGAVDKLPGMGVVVRNSAEMVANSVTPNVTQDSDIHRKSGAKFGNSRGVTDVTGTNGKECVLTTIGGGLQDMARHKNGGDDGTRTRDLRRDRPELDGCNDLQDSTLQTSENPVAPTVAPEIEKGTILDALKGMDRADLLALLNAALDSKGDGA